MSQTANATLVAEIRGLKSSISRAVRDAVQQVV